MVLVGTGGWCNSDFADDQPSREGGLISGFRRVPVKTILVGTAFVDAGSQ